jgi:hypothetical protein
LPIFRFSNPQRYPKIGSVVMFRSGFPICNPPSKLWQFLFDESNPFRLITESGHGKMALPVIPLIHLNEFEIGLRRCLNVGLIRFRSISYEIIEMSMWWIGCIHSDDLNLQRDVKDWLTMIVGSGCSPMNCIWMEIWRMTSASLCCSRIRHFSMSRCQVQMWFFFKRAFWKSPENISINHIHQRAAKQRIS